MLRYAPVSGAAVALADGVGDTPPEMISSLADRRQAVTLSDAPWNAAPSQGFCSSQNRMILFRGVAWAVNLNDVVRNDAAVFAGRVGSARCSHFVGSPAFAFANMPGTVRLNP